MQAVLSHVAVVPSARGAGIGGMLVDAFVSAARSAGAESVILTTQSGAAGAGAFYSKQGWRPAGSRSTLDEGSVDVFELDLGEGRA